MHQQSSSLGYPIIDNKYFSTWQNVNKVNSVAHDLLIMHKVTDSGLPNRFGCRIPINTNWNLDLMDTLLSDYENRDVIEWLRYGFTISRDDRMEDPIPAQSNHLGATQFPDAIDRYIEREVNLGATIGPFTFPPFLSRIGISPLSSREKRNSRERRVILDLSFPESRSVNAGIDKTQYAGVPIDLKYPTIDTLARRIAHLSPEPVLLWKKDMVRAFRQLFLCPRDASYIGYRWRHLLYWDKVMPMGLTSAAYACQVTTSSIVFIHNSLGFWSINYLDDFGSAEKKADAWDSYNLMDRILTSIGIQEAKEKAVPPTTRMEFLGNTVDTVKMTLEVSPDRCKELLNLLKEWKTRRNYSKKQIQSLIGKLSFVTNCVRPGRIFLSRLIQAMTDCPEKGTVVVNEEIINDIDWWLGYLPSFSGVSILWLEDSLKIDELLASDASLIGGGATHGKEYFHFKFPGWILEETDNIAQREIYTIVVAIKLWGSRLAGKVVRFKTDNMISKFAINNGRSKDSFILMCLREITWILAKYEILLRCTYVNTKLNTVPDSLSRWYLDMEARRTFKRLTDRTWVRRSINDQLMRFNKFWL